MPTDSEVRYPIEVLQLTDTHLFGCDEGRLLGVDTYASLKDVISMTAEVRETPAFVLLTGDLSQDETAQSYRRLEELVASIPAPKYCLPGNHDVPALMTEVFAASGAAVEPERTVAWGNWLVVLLDSTVPGQVGGHVSREELERLDHDLSSHRRHHALVCLHHQPVPVGCAWIDSIGVDNGAALLAVVDRHPQVRGILWGHVHQEFAGQREGVALMATPSTCVQFKPLSDGFGIDAKPPGCRWLRLFEDGRLESEVLRLDELPQGLKLSSGGY